MKALKFVILGAGLLGVLSFFLPYAKIDMGSDSLSFNALDVMRGVDLAESGVSEAKKAVEASAELDQRTELRSDLREVEDALDMVKGVIIVVFLPFLIFVVIGIVGAIRGKLGRVGGTFALLLGLVAMGINALFLAAWGSAEVKAAGGNAGFAQYILFVASVTAFIGGLLTLIKPDRGGRFG